MGSSSPSRPGRSPAAPALNRGLAVEQRPAADVPVETFEEMHVAVHAGSDQVTSVAVAAPPTSTDELLAHDELVGATTCSRTSATACAR